MKAVRYHGYGGPEVLCYEDAPIPKPGPGDVLVRVHAAGVNPADRQIRAGLRFRLDKPFAFIPGCELSGVVERAGSEATKAVSLHAPALSFCVFRRSHVTQQVPSAYW